MKNLLGILSLVVTFALAHSAAFADIIAFTDPQLEQLVREHLAVDPGAGNVDDSDVATLTIFNGFNSGVSDLNITSLEGIERCIALTVFSLKRGSFTDITPLTKLPNLETLNIVSNTNFTDLSPFEDPTYLPTLAGNLIGLAFQESNITNLSAIGGLTSLERLTVRSSAALADISPIATLLNLQDLLIDRTNVADISVLADLPRFRTLSADSTPISDLTPLLQNTAFVPGGLAVNVEDTLLTEDDCPQIGTLLCNHMTVRHSLACDTELVTPDLIAVDPVRGPQSGGTEVILTIDLPHLVTTVMFGGEVADEVSRTDSSITVLTPVHVPGPANIELSADRCITTGLSADAFDFRPVATSAVITGTVLDIIGDPVTCAMVIILGDDGTDFRVPTDLDGNFQLLGLDTGEDGLPSTSYELQVYGPGIETITDIRLLASVDFDSETGQALGADGQPGVDIDVTELISGPGTSAAGRVIDLQIFDMSEVAVALSGARIEAFEDGAPMVPPLVTFTCADGRFEIAPLPAKVASNITLNVTAPEYEEQDGVEIPEDNSALEVIMIPKTIFPNVLTGLVLDADLATGIDSARVTVQPPSARLGLNLETADDGLYIVAVPDDGQYTIDVTAQDFIGQLKTTVVDAGTPISVVDFSLVPIHPGEGEGEGEGAGEPPGCGAAVSGGPGSHVWGDSLLVLVAMCVLVSARRRFNSHR